MKIMYKLSKNLTITVFTGIVIFSGCCNAYGRDNYLPSYEPNSFKNTFRDLDAGDSDYGTYLDESDVYYKKGMDFYEANEYTKAIEFLEKAINIAPDRIKTRTNLAVIYINRGTYYFNKEKNYENAANDYRNAIYYLKYDGYKPTTAIAKENLEIAYKNLDNVVSVIKANNTGFTRLNAAKTLRGQGKFKEAVVEYEEALKASPSNIAICEALGDLYRALMKPKQAANYYKLAVDANPDNSSLRLKYARMLNDSGNGDIAAKEFNVALDKAKDDQKKDILQSLENIWIQKIRQNPQDASAHMNLGVVLQKKGDLDGALREYKIAESINPNDITTRLNIVTLYQAKKDYKTAIKAYNTILQVKPDHLLAHYYMGTVLRDSGLINDAIKEFQIVLRAEPDNAAAKEALFDTVSRFSNTEDITNTLSLFAQNNPRDAIAQFKYAFHLHSIGKLDEAMDYYQRTINADPKYVDAYLNIANIYKQRNQIPLAISTLDKAKALMPDNKQVNDMLASIKSETTSYKYQQALDYHTDGEYAKAIDIYKSIIAMNQADSDLYVNLGAAYQGLNNHDEAIKAYQQAIKLDNKNATAHYYLGTVYFNKENFDLAIKSYNTALTYEPSNENIKKAIDAAKQGIVDKYIKKATNEYNQKKYNDALLTLNTALMNTTDNAELYYQRGLVYDALGKYQLAIADYKSAVKYNPDMELAYYAMAVDYDTIKNYVEAKKWYQKFIKEANNQNDEYVQYAKKRLTQI
ncbi:MAG: tetratricopeptide repeat protein [Candidatus Gastranaerophilales bacterium]|nr:tetratricopeptide repeat protein [Candidatus Gastranaerophilales bacterium]